MLQFCHECVMPAIVPAIYWICDYCETTNLTEELEVA